MRLQISSFLALSVFFSLSFALPGARQDTHSPSDVLALYTISKQGPSSIERPSGNPLASRTRNVLLVLFSSIRRFPKGKVASLKAWRLSKVQSESNTNTPAFKPGRGDYKASGRARQPQPNHEPSGYQVPHQAQLVFAPKVTDPNTKANNPSPHPPLIINGSSGVIHMGIPLIPSSAFHLNFTISKDLCTPLASECGCLIDDLTTYILDEYPNGISLPPPPAPLPVTSLPAPLSLQDHRTTPALTSPTVTISDTVRMDLKGRQYRATMTLRLSGRWRPKHTPTSSSNEHDGHQDLSKDADEHTKNCDHGSDSTAAAVEIETTQRDEFRLILGLLGKTAKALWTDVLHRDAGFGALNVKARVGGVDVEADWVFYENRRGVLLRCDWRDVRCLL